MELRCYRITGIVQGVGFRPFIHKLTSKYKINGWILNDSEGVLMEVDGQSDILDSFVNDIRTSAPPMSKVESIIQLPCTGKTGDYKSFEIRKSVTLEATDTLIPPDANVCQDCLNELFDESDSRYKYPFINCTNCGPRYSIIQDMPYDRPKTTMKDFEMCTQCHKEYTDIEDRRYHAQPNACPVCGPKLELANSKGEAIEVDDIISFCQEKLLEGKILGIKSIGGFHLVVNAQNNNAVKELRKRKKRDSKPFAIMVKDIETAKKYVHVCSEEKKLLESVQRPIVILKKKDGALPVSIAPNNPSYGLMLPSAPLHYLLLSNVELPVLVMTSGNISGQPIAYKNEDALELGDVVDYFVFNNRDIHTRVDDSIVRCTSDEALDKTIVSHIRRSRGFAPYPITIHRKAKSVLALGSELKSTIALSKNNQVFVSQHIGDIKNDKVFTSLKDCSAHMQNLLSINPQVIATDSHPHFRSTVEYSKQNQIPVVLVQHHHAHMASCMAENKLDEKVIGVVLDGTGYGTDGSIWGGEFLVGDYSGFERAGALSPMYLLGGDKAVKEPYRVGIDLLYRTYGDSFLNQPLQFLQAMDSQKLHVLHKMSQNKINAFKTSSMGRLFDGISAILNVCTSIEYEAQAAIELESLLNRQFHLGDSFNYEITEKDNFYELDYKQMIKDIVTCVIDKKLDKAQLSRNFHTTVVTIISEMCKKLREKYNVNKVVLSGGVFMNEYLMVNTILLLRSLNFDVYYHSSVPTNDGGISLGQIMIADAVGGNLI